MQTATRGTWLGMAGLITMTGCASMQPTPKDMTFFVTSAGSGKGANLGGLDGADQHCQALAKAAGAGDRTWRAYLSTQAPALNDPNYVNARDRIGTGRGKTPRALSSRAASTICTRRARTSPRIRHSTRRVSR